MLREKMELAASLFVGLLVAWLCHLEAANAATVAGLLPDRRPPGAPSVARNPDAPVDTARYLHGVVPPVPGNLVDIAGTGKWFVPLRSPGMHAPYDLRGWHAQPKAASGGSVGSPSP